MMTNSCEKNKTQLLLFLDQIIYFVRRKKVAHSFLMEAGKWDIEGSWHEKDEMVISVKGKTLIAWSADNWFTMVTKLVFPEHDKADITFQYKGRLEAGELRYNYFLHQSLLGQVEGEGWIGGDSIIQTYLVLSDRQRRSGFETFYRDNEETYYYAGGIRTGLSLTTMMEAVLTRQS
jgi:hypothetical protein